MMTLDDVANRLLPIATLFLGAMLTRLGKRGEARRNAAEQLAELERHVWTKGDEDARIELTVYLGRLAVSLRSAGVPSRLVRHLRKVTEEAWSSTEDTGDPEIGIGMPNQFHDPFIAAQEATLDWLDRPWHVFRRWKAFRKTPRQEQ